MADAKKDEVPTTPADFMAKVNATYKSPVVRSGETSTEALSVRRLSSGILSMDCALGGGWPFSRVSIIAGAESTGKTLVALKAAKEVEKYDHDTHLRIDRKPPLAPFTPGRCMFMDVEHSFDLEWAKVHGWNNDHHYVCKPEYAEQAIDIVTDAIRGNVFDLIVVDSIAALTPSTEIEESSEDWQMGLGARLTNKAMRRWNASLIKASMASPHGGPVLLCLNQFRIKIGVMFGDPRIMPNGEAQKFAASIIVFTSSATVANDTKADHGFGEYGGLVGKNKTFTPKCNYKYRMALKDQDGWPKGQVDNDKQAVMLGKTHSLITAVKGGGWEFGTYTFKNQAEIEDRFEKDDAFRCLLWRSIVAAFTGTTGW